MSEFLREPRHDFVLCDHQTCHRDTCEYPGCYERRDHLATPRESYAEPRAYTNRHSEPCSQACGEGRHADCTETLETCNCTFRGSHKTAHRYATMSESYAEVEGERKVLRLLHVSGDWGGIPFHSDITYDEYLLIEKSRRPAEAVKPPAAMEASVSQTKPQVYDYSTPEAAALTTMRLRAERAEAKNAAQQGEIARLKEQLSACASIASHAGPAWLKASADKTALRIKQAATEIISTEAACIEWGAEAGQSVRTVEGTIRKLLSDLEADAMKEDSNA